MREETIERWEKIPGYEGFEASSSARIRRTTDGKILNASRGKSWVRQVMLPGYGIRCLHILIGATFIGPCPPNDRVQFRDNNSHNCKPENLYYGPARGGHRSGTLTTKGGAAKIPHQQMIEKIWHDLLPETERVTKRVLLVKEYAQEQLY